MPRILDFSDGFYIERFEFGQAQVSAGQSAVAIPVHGAKAADGSSLVVGITMPYAGSVIGVTADLNAAASAGTGSVAVTKGGTADAASALTITTVATARTKFDGQSVVRFAAGDILGVKITTSAQWDATTSDVVVNVYVLFEKVQP